MNENDELLTSLNPASIAPTTGNPITSSSTTAITDPGTNSALATDLFKFLIVSIIKFS